MDRRGGRLFTQHFFTSPAAAGASFLARFFCCAAGCLYSKGLSLTQSTPGPGKMAKSAFWLLYFLCLAACKTLASLSALTCSSHSSANQGHEAARKTVGIVYCEACASRELPSPISTTSRTQFTRSRCKLSLGAIYEVQV